MILETLFDSFRIGLRDSQRSKAFHMRVKGSLGSSTYKKITTTTNKEILRERMRKQA